MRLTELRDEVCMRLKEDSYSWKSGGVKRKMERQARDPVVERPFPKKKDTKRWCRGKEGVEHEIVEREKTAGYHGIDVKERACKNCDKVFQVWSGWFGEWGA